MENVFAQVLSLFLLLLVGFMVRKWKLIDGDFTSKLTKLIMSVFLPAMIIHSMQLPYDVTMVGKIIQVIILSLVMYALSFCIALIAKYIFHVNHDLGIYQFAIVFSNAGFMGYPVLNAVLGKESIFYASIFNLPFNLLIMTLGVFLLTQGRSNHTISIQAFINPVIISIVIGLILFLLNVQLPALFNEPLKLLGDVTTPLSMLAIGSMLCGTSAFDFFFNKHLYMLAFIRLIVVPVCLFFLIRSSVHDHLLFAIPVIISAMPAASNTAILANEYEANGHLAAQAVFLTTLLSLITIPLIVGLFIR